MVCACHHEPQHMFACMSRFALQAMRAQQSQLSLSPFPTGQPLLHPLPLMSVCTSLLVLLQVEYFAYHKTVSKQKLCAIALLMFGISIATVSDKQVSSNPLGILVAGLAVLSSSLYQVRYDAGAMQICMQPSRCVWTFTEPCNGEGHQEQQRCRVLHVPAVQHTAANTILMYSPLLVS